MNQILVTKLKLKSKSKSFNIFLKLQFCFSIFCILILLFYLLFSKLNLLKQEKYSNLILNNYNITRLYSNISDSNLMLNNNITSIFGIIEIPSINIYYPIFSNCNESLLKISPCRFFGPFPGNKGNLCIAGHNYDNNSFFSKINLLTKNDEILIYDNNKNVFHYFVFEIFEVKNDDFSPIYNYDINKVQLTLITCNNLNKNRIVVKCFNK